MFCENCGHKKDSNAKFCSGCGIKNEERVDKVKNLEEYKFLHIPVTRLLWVSVLSLGFYPIYWFYKNWLAVQKVTGEKMMPLARGIFSIFWSKDIFYLPLKQAKHYGYKYSYNASFFAVLYFISVIISRGYEKYSGADDSLMYWVLTLIILLVVLFPLLKTQQVINWTEDKRDKVFDKIGTPEIGTILLVWGLSFLYALAQ